MARPKLGTSETKRLHMKLTADELKAIEDWRYANRVPSLSEAVRQLVQAGLSTGRTQPKEYDWGEPRGREILDEWRRQNITYAGTVI